MSSIRKMLLVALSLPVATAAQESCPTDWRWNSIGVDAFHCNGGKCAYEMNRTGPGIGFTFSAEPRMRGVDPRGPSAGRLQEGDVLVAVNERLIVTSPGGAELGGLTADSDAKVTVRRGDRLIQVEVRPRTTCRTPTLLIGETVIEDALSTRRAVMSGALDLTELAKLQGGGIIRTLGASIRCPECGYSVQRGTPSRIRLLVGRIYPVIASTERGGMADRAGLRVDDELRRISGVDVLTTAGAELLISPPRGEFSIDVVRDGRALRFDVGTVSRVLVIDGVSVVPPLESRDRAELRIVRQGDTLRSNDVLGTVIRWWLATRREESAPAMLVTRGESWGDGDIGFLLGNDRLNWRYNTGAGAQNWSFDRPLRVVEVIANSLAERAGLRRDDVITHANDTDVHTDAGARALMLSPRRNPLELKVTRDGREVTLTIPPRAM